MKRMILTVLAAAGLGTVCAIGFHRSRINTIAVPATMAAAEAIPENTIEEPQSEETAGVLEARQNPASSSIPPAANEADQRTAQIRPPVQITSDPQLVFLRGIDSLVSSRTSFDEKQAQWKRLIEAGKLDQAIGELEQRTANDPRQAETVAALGLAYLKKAGTIQDARERAMSAMKADQTLEAALSLDPDNWEARYSKAVGMSYWPKELNKSQEVIDQFLALIQQQEAQPPQPHFARAYSWLGSQYQKAGQSGLAAQVWQRGAALFPNNEELKSKLAATR